MPTSLNLSNFSEAIKIKFYLNEYLLQLSVITLP